MTLSGNPATFNDAKTAATFATAANVVSEKVTYTVSGKTPIAEGKITANLTLEAKAGYDIQAERVLDVAELFKSGVEEDLELVFSPATSYPQFVRISNTGTQAGKINLTVFNDNGDFSSFPLSAIAGQPATLAAGASTTQLSTAAVFAAAQAAKPTFDVVNDKKMRIVVSGEVTKLSVQSYVVSKDGQNLGRF